MHLPAGIVDVVFSLHFEANEVQQVRQRRAEGRAAPMADVQRTGRIGGDEFDLDPVAVAEFAGAEALTLFENARHHRVTGSAGDEKIDEPGPCHLDPDNAGLGRQPLDNGLGQRARRHTCRFRQGQRNIRREVTLARIFRRGYLDIDIEFVWNPRVLLQRLYSLRDQIVDDLLQKLKPAAAMGKK